MHTHELFRKVREQLVWTIPVRQHSSCTLAGNLTADIVKPLGVPLPSATGSATSFHPRQKDLLVELL